MITWHYARCKGCVMVFCVCALMAILNPELVKTLFVVSACPEFLNRYIVPPDFAGLRTRTPSFTDNSQNESKTTRTRLP